MMKRNLLKTLFAGGLLPVNLLVACDVHEFPIPVEPEKRQVVLNLSFDTDMPVHQVVDVRTRASIDPQDYDMRYTVCIYRADADGTFGRVEDVRTVVAKDDVTDPDNSIGIELEDGDYRFIAWADYVDAGTLDHKFFNTDDFAEIALLTDSYSGGTEFRDAFHGTADATVSAGTVPCEVTVQMERPQARYRFVSTDLAEFITRMQAIRAEQEAAAAQEEGRDPDHVDESAINIDLNEFRVVVRYSGYMPSAFNLFTGQTADAVTGVQFDSGITKMSESEADLGFDYVLVNGDESSVQVALDIYDKDGTRLSSSNPIEVPIARGKQTVVQGKFLTSEASGGIGISPGFDGDWNYPVQ